MLSDSTGFQTMLQLMLQMRHDFAQPHASCQSILVPITPLMLLLCLLLPSYPVRKPGMLRFAQPGLEPSIENLGFQLGLAKTCKTGIVHDDLKLCKQLAAEERRVGESKAHKFPLLLKNPE